MPTAEPSWTRLEPAPRQATADLAAGLRAEVHDPLWLLARQLQFRELRGEDAGSPVAVSLQGACSRLTRYRPGPPDGTGQPYDGSRPLEEVVEAEPLGDRPLRLAAAAGLQFLRLLEAEGVGGYADAYRQRYRLAGGEDLDPAGRRFLAVVAGRALNGTALQSDLAAGGAGLPPEPPIAGNDIAAVTRAARRFMAWYAALDGSARSPAWTPSRLEYQFSVAGPLGGGEAVFTAVEYDQGRLDWSSFDLAPAGATLGAAGDPGSTDLRRAGLPTPVAYRGMPAARFWQFDDAAVDFGDLTAAPEELSKLLLIQFAMAYGNDHFVVPIDVDVGSVCRVERLVVTDTFGQEIEVRHVAEVDRDAQRSGTFRLFELGAAGVRSPLFLLAPALAQNLSGAPIEEVRLQLDEGANLAWAVEATASRREGFPTDRAGARPAPPPSDGAGTDGDRADGGPIWRYRLRTPVPDHWFPLVPIADRPGVNHLELGSIARPDGSPAAPPWGRMLAELASAAIPEEEVTRSSTRLTRAWQYARWVDGRQHAWIGRRRDPAASEGDSGLRYDAVEPITGSTDS